MHPDEIEVLGALFSEEAADVELVAEPEIGGFFDTVANVGKSIIKSPITKAVAGGVAIAFPAVGVPLSVGLVVADKAVRTAEGTKGTPKQQEAMRRTVKNTVALAKKGDPGAKRAVGMMAAAVRVRATVASQAARAAVGAVKRVTKPVKAGKVALRYQPPAKKAEGGVLVKRGGIVQRGVFVDAK